MMADDRVIHCLFERKHQFSKHYSTPLEENHHFKNKSKRKRKHSTFINSSKEISHIEKDFLSTMYMQRQKRSKYKQIKNNKLLYSGEKIAFLPLILNSTGDLKVASHYSTPEVPSLKAVIAKKACSNTTPFKSNFIVNRCCCDKNGCSNLIKNSWKQPQIYRCQTSSKKVCCCNCNSDAMFEVMKSLYDCYKNKNCDNCKCVLCGPKFRVQTISRAIGVGERGMDDVYAEIEGKTPSQKKIVLKKMAQEGYRLPRGRSPSEEDMIIQVKRSIGVMTPKMPSEKIRKARAAGLLTPLKGKTPREKERILRDLAAVGMPLPLAQTASEKRLISKVRRDMGLPPEPRNKSERIRMAKAYADGIITPLNGKTRTEKESALRRMEEAGVPLPEGRTPSERDLIERVKKTTRRVPSKLRIPSAKLRRAKEQGLLTPLEGKTHEEKERILKGLARSGIPLPEPKTYSERKLIEGVRRDLGLPPEPQTESEKRRMAKGYAAGIVTPLEGKTRAQKEEVLRKMAEAGVPLPEGRTASERSLIERVKKTQRSISTELEIPSEKIRRARAEGILTPLEGKRPEEKERILRGLAKNGIPLPEGKTSSERKLINKIRRELGLPREPQTESEKIKMAKGYAAGIVTPLEGKTRAQKEEVLRKMAEAGVPLPEGRTASERSLMERVKRTQRRISSELEIPSEKIKRARAEGILTPLEGKRPEEKERILRGLAKNGIPLPEGKTSSERKLINKIRRELGLPREPQTESEKRKMAKGYAAGIVTPLEGKTRAQKEEVLRKMAEAGVPLPEGRTASERSLIERVKRTQRRISSELEIPSEKIRRARAEGILTPLEGKRPEEKERILRGLAKNGIPLPEGKTSSERKLIHKIRRELGLPREPQTELEKRKMAKAYAAGIITPLEGKTTSQKEKILRKMADAGVPLPEGRTASEKELINKIKTEKPRVPIDKLRRARTEGFLTPLEGKTAAEKERILKGLAKAGIPLPEGKTRSEKRIIQKVRRDLGLPSEPRTASEKKRLSRAYAEGIITPLEGKSPAEKEKILRRMVAAGVPLPEGRTSSERDLIEKVRQPVVMDDVYAEIEGKTPSQKKIVLKKMAQEGYRLPRGRSPSEEDMIVQVKRSIGVMTPQIPSEKIRKARAAGLLTPLEGKTDREKENILRGLAKAGMPLPDATTSSESRLIEKVRRDLGLPPKPRTGAEKNKMTKAYAAGIITPLEGKSPAEKERALRRMAEAGVSLPEGRTPSERDLIEKVKRTAHHKPSVLEIASEKLRRAKTEGLLTPLDGKTHSEKERILRGLAKAGIPLPQAKTQSEKKLIDNIRKDLGLPPEPQTETEKRKVARAYAEGIITPLEGKTTAQKEQILRRMAEAGISLPEARTASEKDLIKKMKAELPRIPTEKLQKVRDEGLLTPLDGKTTAEKERILRGLALHGVPLPEGKTSSERRMIQNIRKELGLPPEPKTPSEKVRLSRAFAAGIITPLEGKSASEKERILRRMAAEGVPLPEGRTSSERALIAKVIKEGIKETPDRIRAAKTEGLLTPLHGKSPEEKEKILRGLAKHGLPLPEGKTASEKRIVAKVKRGMGLPPKPDTASEKIKLEKAYAEGIITPLEGKTHQEKERALRRMAEAGVHLPEGRTASEKALINKVLATTARVPTEKLRRAKAEGLLTPLEGKTQEQKEQILRGLAKAGVPLPDGTTQSEKNLIQKIRKDLGLPPPPQTMAERKKMNKAYAAGIITPLEGKTYAQKERALQKMAEAGINLPEGRTASERALINKVKATTLQIPSEKLRRAKREGWLTPLEGKSPKKKEKILRGLAKRGVPLPEGKTKSEKDLIRKVKREMGVAEPRTLSEKEMMDKGYEKGLITPLEGKTTSQKEKALRKMLEAGVPLPEGRTASERALIKKIKATVQRVPSEKLRRAKEEGWLTPLEGKPQEEKERILRGLVKAGVPLPEAKTRSEKDLIRKVRTEMGLPLEPDRSSEKLRMTKAYARGIVTPLEGKTTSQKEKALRKMAEAGVPLPEGRTASERALVKKIKATVQRVPSEKLRRAKEEGWLTPLEGKSQKEKERILRGLAKAGVPLPEGKTRSEKDLIRKVRRDMGLPPEPSRSSEQLRMAKAYARGIITPLEGKTTSQKEKALRKMAEAGVPLPEGRTASERELIKKVKATVQRVPSEKLRRAKEEGWLTPLEGKPQEEKEQILRGLAKAGVPLPEAKTRSEKDLIRKVRRDMGLPPEPSRSSEQLRMAKAYARGIITPLEGKTTSQKEKALRKMAEAGVPLPEGRTASERALIKKVKATVQRVPSEKIRRAKEEGWLTPLEGKPQEEKEQILRGLAKAGVPLPEGKTRSEKDLIRKVRTEMGLPPEPDRSSEKLRMTKAYAQGVVTPLEGKRYSEKERALKRMAEAGVPLPEGRTTSERALIKKIKATVQRVPSEKLRRAKEEGWLTPLEGKSQKEKERILRGLAKAGVPLPEGKTRSEKDLIRKVRRDMGLPPKPSRSSEQLQMAKAYARGIITPLEGKTTSQKEKALRKMAEAGVHLPEGRTASERALIKKVKATVQRVPSEKLRRAKEEGWLTPLEGKPQEEKERILRGLAKAGVPLPEGKTRSEKDLIRKVRTEMGLPPESDRSSEKLRMTKAYAQGIVTPLEGKTTSQKEKALRKMAERGVPLPEGRTASERALIKKVKATVQRVPSEKLRTAKEEGWLTPLEGKPQEEKERILRGLAKAGVPLPEGKTRSEKDLIRKVRTKMGLPPESDRSSEQLRIARGYAQGIITPLEGKRYSEKERALKRMAEAGVPLPKGRTASERALIAKVKATTPRVPAARLRKAREEGLLTPLQGKTNQEKEKILRGLAKAGVPLPEGKTLSEKQLIDRVRIEMGLPPEPISATEKVKLSRAYAAGIITPLEGKTQSEKEQILRRMVEAGVPLPEGRTASERALIKKVVTEEARPTLPRIASEKLRKARAAGILTPLEGKTKKEKEKIMRKIAKAGLPLPKAHTPSEQLVIDKVRRDLGLPPEPKTSSEKLLMTKQYALGVITPLKGKSRKKKEKALRKMAIAGIPLPEGRTSSERALIEEIKKRPIKVRAALSSDKRQKLDKATGKVVKESIGPSDECICDLLTPDSEKEFRLPPGKLRAARAEGLLTPLEGKPLEQKERILRRLAERGLPLPEGKTASEKRLVEKVKRDLGLPPEPETPSEKLRLEKAYAAGFVEPLEGKSRQEKEKILQRMAKADIPLPEGRTASEKALIDKVLTTIRKVPSEKFRRAKAEGLLTPMEGKTRQQKENILRGIAKAGLPFPELKTQSERDLADKVRRDLGLPPNPRTRREKQLMAKAYAEGIITPLEGKSTSEKDRALRRMAEAGVPLPEGRTASEKALIAKIKAKIPRVPADRLHRAKTEGWLTPLEGKSLEQKEKILRGLAKSGMPLQEGKTPSERRLIEKVRREMGLPPEPTSPSEKVKLSRAYAAGIVTPLEGKSHSEKERILRRMAAEGIPLPVGRTTSEKALINKIRKDAERDAVLQQMTSEKLRAIKAEGLLSPLLGKTTEEKEKILRGLAKAGVPLPEASTPSERIIVDRVRRDMGLPPEPRTSLEKKMMAKAYAAGIITPLEGKSTTQKEKALRKMAKAGIPLPEGRTNSERALIAKIRASALEKVPSEKLRRAKAEGLLTPLEGKGAEERERILRGLTKAGIPLPEGKTTSEKRIIQKVRRDLRLPPEPMTSAERHRQKTAYAKGIITPLEGKTHAEKENILRRMAEAGISLPEGKTASEKELIDHIKKTAVVAPPSEKIRAARAAGLLTPLEGKTTAEKEAILRGLAKGGLPLPVGKTPSEKRLIQKVRRDIGLPPEPISFAEKQRINKAYAAGIITPLEGKSHAEKERVLRRMAQAGVPLPEGRTPSERDLIDKIKNKTVLAPPSDKMRAARAAGLLSPLEGKTAAQKEEILRGLAKGGLPLPEGRTSSERRLIQQVRKDMGLPPEPRSSAEKQRINKAYAAGIITPLEGKSHSEKERVLRQMALAGVPLPVGRTPSEKELIDKIKKKTAVAPASDKVRRDAGFLTPLEDKSPEEKERILKGLARAGVPLPEGRTASERKMIQNVRKQLGLPPQPRTSSERIRIANGYANGIISPLNGKSKSQKEKILRKMADAGIPLPEGRTESEQNLINSINAEVGPKYFRTPSEKIKRAKTLGLLTPLQEKTDAEKELILRGLAKEGLPLPKGKTPSEKLLVDKVLRDMGLPPKPQTSSERRKYEKAYAAGIITPLEGKTRDEKEKVLKKMTKAGIELPEGRTASERSLINKVRKQARGKLVTRGTGVTEEKARAGITEEIEEIVKTTKCDQACGCDRKKIRFKHSYIKIRVTSPDISSFCSCPDDCLPGVRGGVFVDNEGIKVTVGRAIGTPSYTPSSGSIRTPLSVTSLDFSQSSETSVAATISDNYVHSITNMTDVLSNAIFDLYQSNSSVKSQHTHSMSSEYINIDNYESICAMSDKNNFTFMNAQDSINNYQSDRTCDIKHSQGDNTDQCADKGSQTSVHSQGDLDNNQSKNESSNGLKKITPDVKSCIDLLSPRSFVTNSSSYDSIIILLTDSSSSSYIDELGTISIVSLENDSETYMTRKRISNYFRDISQESERFKRSVDYTVETNISNTYSKIQDYHVKESLHKMKQTNYTRNNSKTKRADDKTKPLPKDKCADRANFISLKEILAQRELTDTSSVCVLMSSEGTVTTTSTSAVLTPLLAIKECKSPNHTKVKSGHYYIQNLPKRNENTTTSTSYHKRNMNENRKRRVHSIGNSTKNTMLQNNVGTTLTEVERRRFETSSKTHEAENRRNKDRQTSRDQYLTSKYIKSKHQINTCAQGLDINIKKELSRKEPFVKFTKKAKPENNNRTISKLKKLIYTDGIDTSTSIMVLEGTGTKDKPFCCRQLRKHKNEQVPDVITYKAMQGETSSQDLTSDYQAYYYSRNDLHAKTQQTDLITKKYQDKGEQVKICKHCNPQHQAKETSIRRRSRNRPKLLDPKMSSSVSAYPVLAEPGMQILKKDASCVCKFSDFEVIIIDLKENKATSCDNQSRGVGYINQVNEEFIRQIDRCPNRSVGQTNAGHRTLGAQTMTQVQQIRPAQQSPQPCACAGPGQAHLSPLDQQKNLYSKNRDTAECHCPKENIQSTINHSPQNRITQTQDGTTTCPNRRINPSCMQSPNHYYDPAYQGFQSNQVTQTPISEYCHNISPPSKPCNCSQKMNHQQQMTSHAADPYTQTTLREIGVGPDCGTTNQPCKWKQISHPCSNYPLPSTLTQTEEHCICPEPPVLTPITKVDTACCPDDDLIYTYDDLFWLDKRDIMKLKSDWSQAKTGFKFQMTPKMVEADMSIEDAIEYYKRIAEAAAQEQCKCEPIQQQPAGTSTMNAQQVAARNICNTQQPPLTVPKHPTRTQGTKAPKRFAVTCECPPPLPGAAQMRNPAPGLQSNTPCSATPMARDGLSVLVCGKGYKSPGFNQIYCYDALDIISDDRPVSTSHAVTPSSGLQSNTPCPVTPMTSDELSVSICGNGCKSPEFNKVCSYDASDIMSDDRPVSTSHAVTPSSGLQSKTPCPVTPMTSDELSLSVCGNGYKSSGFNKVCSYDASDIMSDDTPVSTSHAVTPSSGLQSNTPCPVTPMASDELSLSVCGNGYKSSGFNKVCSYDALSIMSDDRPVSTSYAVIPASAVSSVFEIESNSSSLLLLTYY